MAGLRRGLLLRARTYPARSEVARRGLGYAIDSRICTSRSRGEVAGLCAGAAVFAWLYLAFVGVARAQEELPEPKAPDPSVFGSAVGQLVARGETRPLPYTLTVQGPVVSLPAVVRALGGELVSGPLGQSFTLKLLDDEFVLGPDSAAMTQGEQIIALSRPPLLGTTGLEVPIDALISSYGERLGFGFRWLPEPPRLEVTASGRESLAVELSSVHLGGTTSLVLSLAREARFRAEPTNDGVDLVFPGQQLEQVGAGVRPDPLLRTAVVGQNRVRIALQAGAQAADPYLVPRAGRTQVVVDISKGDVRGTPREVRPIGPAAGLKIVIDPGHGGSESGAIGPAGTMEKELTLAISRLLRSRLEARLPARVVLTRDDDDQLDLVSRTAIANQNQADLFISIHLNSVLGGEGVRGAETYILDADASDARAEASARFENTPQPTAPAAAEGDGSGAEEEAELDLQLTLWDLAQSRHLAESLRLATLIQQELNQTLDLRDRGVKQAPFKVLSGANMPAVLVELGFLSHPDEEARLTDPAYRAGLVDALVAAVVRYWTARRGEGTASAASSSAAQRRGAAP